MVGTGIDRSTFHHQLVARGLDLATGAAQVAATRGDRPGKAGHGALAVCIAPEHHLAAVALLCGAGVDAGAFGHGDGGGLVNAVAPLPIAAHQHRAAAGDARGDNFALVQQLEVVAQHVRRTALALAAAHAQGAVAHHGQTTLAWRIGQRLGLGLVRLNVSRCTQSDAATLAATGIQAGVVQLDVTTGLHIDVTALGGHSHRGWAGGRAGTGGRRRCFGLGRDVNLPLQLNLACGLDVQLAAFLRAAQIDAAGVGLRELGGLNLDAACTEGCFGRGCAAVGS